MVGIDFLFPKYVCFTKSNKNWGPTAAVSPRGVHHPGVIIAGPAQLGAFLSFLRRLPFFIFTNIFSQKSKLLGFSIFLQTGFGILKPDSVVWKRLASIFIFGRISRRKLKNFFGRPSEISLASPYFINPLINNGKLTNFRHIGWI